MQDPDGDGQIVYIFLPLYRVSDSIILLYYIPYHFLTALPTARQLARCDECKFGQQYTHTRETGDGTLPWCLPCRASNAHLPAV